MGEWGGDEQCLDGWWVMEQWWVGEWGGDEQCLDVGWG